MTLSLFNLFLYYQTITIFMQIYTSKNDYDIETFLELVHEHKRVFIALQKNDPYPHDLFNIYFQRKLT